ncbi:MAG TPA: response regulator [Candidatus Paceibacterota bacterium]|nr:response regulator [Candidatus Paceibacterota bacterium]
MPDSRPLRALLIEPESVVAITVKRWLEGFGYQVTDIQSAVHVNLLLVDTKYDLLVITSLRGREALEETPPSVKLLEELRGGMRFHLNRKVPIVFHSGRGLDHTVAQRLAIAYVAKPSTQATLEAGIAKAQDLADQVR